MDDTGIKTEIRNGERRDAETEAFVTAMMILFLSLVIYLIILDSV